MNEPREVSGMRALKRNGASKPLRKDKGAETGGGLSVEAAGGYGGDRRATKAKAQRLDVVTCVIKVQRGVRVPNSKGRGAWILWEGQWELSCLLSTVAIPAGVGTVVTQWRSEPTWVRRVGWRQSWEIGYIGRGELRACARKHAPSLCC